MFLMELAGFKIRLVQVKLFGCCAKMRVYLNIARNFGGYSKFSIGKARSFDILRTYRKIGLAIFVWSRFVNSFKYFCLTKTSLQKFHKIAK